MLKSLYSKMLAWLLLNLLLIALVGGGFVFFVLFSNTYGLVPASLFSSNVENVFRVLSTELQYRSTQEWSAMSWRTPATSSCSCPSGSSSAAFSRAA